MTEGPNVPGATGSLSDALPGADAAVCAGSTPAGKELGLVLEALLSPLVLVCPRWLARRCRAQPVQVPLWELGLAALMFLAWVVATTPTVPKIEELLALSMGAGLLVGLLGLGCLLVAVAARPVAAAWHESRGRAFWKAFSLVVCLVLPVLVVAGVGNILIDSLVLGPLYTASWATDSQEHGMAWLKALLWQKAFHLALVLGGLVQVLRGLLWEGGLVPLLEPLCRDCGYSLEGVREAYRASAAGEDAAEGTAIVCSECGCGLALSMEPSARPGTAWTRGEDLSLRSWWRTVRQVQGRPGEFFTRLPLGASRGAALRFWMMNLAGSFAVMAGILLIDYLVCQGTRVTGPVWPGYDVEPAYQWMNGSPYWFLAALNSTGKFLVMVWLPAAALGGLDGARLGWRMSRLRGRNMHPAGFLLTAYLSGHMLGAFLLMLAVPMVGRIVAGAIPEPLLLVPAAICGASGLAAGLAWYVRAARAAQRGLQYANSSCQWPVAS